MPIITPAYPQQNSTFNVSQSTRSVMMDEFKMGLNITDEIMLNRQTWDKLFDRPQFFLKYKHFIVLLVSAETADDHLEWCGLVESKVRLLIGNKANKIFFKNIYIYKKFFVLHKKFNFHYRTVFSLFFYVHLGNLERNQYIKLAHINPESFCQLESQKEPNTHCAMWFIGLVFNKREHLNVDLTKDIQAFTETINKHATNTNILKVGMKLEARHVKRKQLSQYLAPSLLKRERRTSITNNKLQTNGTENRKRLSSETGNVEIDVPNKKTRISDELGPNVNFNSKTTATVRHV